jgi:hypothetical protein
MSHAIELLRNPEVELSVAWQAAMHALGTTIGVWEPDTIRIELERHKVPATDSLMAKLLAAQTIVTGSVWTYDHDVFFSMALACDGIPAAANAIPHPTPEQLCWAVLEIERLTGERITEDHGFDPDTIDPAVAAVLHDEGMVLAPDPLSFAQDVLDKFTKLDWDFVNRVEQVWLEKKKLPYEALQRILREEPTTALDVQIHHLAMCRVHCDERMERRVRQNAILQYSV